MNPELKRAKARFADFEFDLHSGELLRNGNRVRLQVQPLRVLTLLLEHAQDLVLREELHRLLWPGQTFVDFEHGINKAVAKLRRALYPSSLIETFPRRGYRFAARVEWIADDADLANRHQSASPVALAVAMQDEVPVAPYPLTQAPSLVVIAPDLLDTFPDAESVNQALRHLKNIAVRSAADRKPPARESPAQSNTSLG